MFINLLLCGDLASLYLSSFLFNQIRSLVFHRNVCWSFAFYELNCWCYCFNSIYKHTINVQTSLSPPHSAPLFFLRIHCIAYFWFSWRLNTNISQCYLQWEKSHLYLVFWCKIYDLLCRFACKLQLLLLIFNPVHFRCESFAINVCNCSPFLFLYPALLCPFLATRPLRDRGMAVASNNNNRCFWLNVLYNLVLHNFAPTLFLSVDHKINYHHCCCCHHCYRQLHATIVCSCISFSLSQITCDYHTRI